MKEYLIMAGVATLTIAIVFRVAAIRNVVVGS